MRRFCTYFDVNYLVRGLALYRSLEALDEPFELSIICFDAQTRHVLEALALPCAKLFDIDELERFDPELFAVRASRKNYEYYWTSTPCVPRFLFARDPSIDAIAYLDSDLFFFSSFEPLFTELHDASVLIVEHAFTPGLKAKDVGRFNVGSITFRNDAAGHAVIDDWRARCLEWCFDRFEPGRFGDQVYLDAWPDRFKDTVAIAPRGGIGVGPWNEKGRIGENGLLVDGSPIVYYHFHALRLLSTWAARVTGYRLSKNAKTWLYAPYLAALRDAFGELERVVDGRPGAVGFKPADVLGGMARRDLVLLLGDRLLTFR